MQDQYARPENVGLENAAPVDYARVEIAGLENAGNDILWKTMNYLRLLDPATFKVQRTQCTLYAVCCDRRPAHVVQWSNHLGAMCSRA